MKFVESTFDWAQRDRPYDWVVSGTWEVQLRKIHSRRCDNKVLRMMTFLSKAHHSLSGLLPFTLLDVLSFKLLQSGLKNPTGLAKVFNEFISVGCELCYSLVA